MKASVWGICVILVCVSVGSPLFAATVKKKDGQVVEGEIKSLIVQKEVKQSKEDGKTTYTVGYFITNGRDITVIDEEGVYLSPGIITRFWVASSGIPLGDIEVLGATIGPPLFPRVLQTEGGEFWLLAPATRDKQVPIAEKLLGEFRVEQDKHRLIQAIEVVTKAGVVTILVGEIVEFKKKAEGQGEEKRE